MMNSLTEAILKNDAARIREVLAMSPNLICVRGESGWLPRDLARRSGNALAEAALIRLQAPSDLEPDYSSCLRSAVSSISYAHSGETFLNDINFFLWHLLETGEVLDLYGYDGHVDPYQFARLDADTLKDLRVLSNQSHDWPWNLSESISLEAWKVWFEKWYKKYQT